MKKILTLILISLSATFAVADDYADLLALAELNNLYKEASRYAELRLWYLRQTQPKIFIQIESADNATDMGDFRKDFYKQNNFKKLQMLDENNWLFNF